MEIELCQEIGNHLDERLEPEIGVIRNRRAVCTERKPRHDAAVAVSQRIDDVVPQCAVHQHPMENDDRRSPPAILSGLPSDPPGSTTVASRGPRR